MNTIVVRTENDGDRLDFLKFRESENGTVYADSSGYDLPLNAIIHHTPEGMYSVKTVRKTKLAAKMLKVLGETDNFYIVRDDK